MIARAAVVSLLLWLFASPAGAVSLVGTVPVGNSPFAVAVTPDGTQAVVVNLFPVRNPDGTDGPNVRVVDLVAQREVREFRAGTRLVSVAVTGTTALVVNEDQDAVRVLNVATGQQVGQIGVGSRPSDVITLSPATAVVANGTSGDVMFIDLATGRASAPLAVGKDPRDIALHPGGRYAYVALGGENAIAVVDLQGTPRVVNRIVVGRNPVSIAFSRDGSRAVAVDLSSNMLTVLDTSDPSAPRFVVNVPAGVQPTGAVFGSSDPNVVFVSNQGANFVTVVDISKPKTQMVQGVIDLGTTPSGLAVSGNGARLYVTEFKNDANLRIYDVQNLTGLAPAPVFEIPGEPASVSSFAARGDCATDFYIATATLAPGASGGFWGMEVGLSREPRELTGGFNLGGGFDGGGRNPGFGAFSLSSPQRVTATINAQPLSGPIALRVDLNKDGQRVTGVEGTPTASSPLRFSADLAPGFYVVTISSTASSGRGTFQLGLETPGSFNGGVVVGGYLTRDATGASLTGFGAFCVPQTQDVSVKLFGQSEYAANAAGDLVLTLRDAQRNVIRVVDNALPGPSLVEPPPAPPVPATIRYYVDAKAASGGNGSSAAPFRSISTALAAAQAGDVVFVRKGVYAPSTTNEQLPLGASGNALFRNNVQIVGEGADGTIIDGENSANNVVQIAAPGVRFAGFTVKRAGAVGIYVFRSSGVTIENNFATGNVRFGIGGEGSSALIVRNNVASANFETGIAFIGSLSANAPAGAPASCAPIAAGAYGAWIVNNTASDNRADGILTGAGGIYCVAENFTNNNGSSGIEFNNRVESGTVPPLHGAVVNNSIIGNGAQQFAFAGTGILSTENGATIDVIEGNDLKKNRPYGIGIFLEGRAGRIAGNRIADTSTSGILVRTRAAVDQISGNVVTGSGLDGIFLDDASSVTSIIANQSTGNDRGLSVLDRSAVTLIQGNDFNDNKTLGVEIVGNSVVTTVTGMAAMNNGAAAPLAGAGFQVRDGARVTMFQNSRVANNQGQGGVYVSNGSELTMSGVVIDANATQGIFASGAGTRVSVTGGSVTNTRRDAGGQNGFGVNVQQGASVTCSAVSLSANAAGNVFTASGGVASGC